VLTFKKLLTETSFVADMRSLLETLEKAYDYPVDVEFTTNFLPDGSYRINLVQCRPFQVKGGGPVVALPDAVPSTDLVLKTQGAVIGPSLAAEVGRLIYVVPSVYSELPPRDRYSIARLIGRLTRLENQSPGALLLAGPGRWGTTEPTLGVPVSFAEISRVTALCEVIEMREGLVPDVSLGTHFFNDLVEMQVLYLALIPGKEGNCVNSGLIEQAPNQLAALIPSEAGWAKAVRVIDPASIPGAPVLRLRADALRQCAICYFDPR
jgi:pyruvate,water dikinase